MTDDIVTRLRGSADCVCLFHVEHGLTRKCLYCEAADEIERLRLLAHNLYEETKRCGTTHDTGATWDYEQWLEDND